VEVPQIQTVEKIVEIPQIQTVEKVMDKIREVPQVQLITHGKKKVQIQELIEEVPKLETQGGW
jgi:hypothetical protein